MTYHEVLAPAKLTELLNVQCSRIYQDHSYIEQHRWLLGPSAERHHYPQVGCSLCGRLYSPALGRGLASLHEIAEPDGAFAGGVDRVTKLLHVLMTDIINNRARPTVADRKWLLIVEYGGTERSAHPAWSGCRGARHRNWCWACWPLVQGHQSTHCGRRWRRALAELRRLWRRSWWRTSKP